MVLLYTLCALSCILSVITLPYTIYCHIKLAAMEKSTHTVTWKPVDTAWDKENDKFEKSLEATENKLKTIALENEINDTPENFV